eukprot:TRINITY_DN2626_c0_g1_i1.p1 TRINITY_DN2626_c0_g1~~TRINITY_DN2626_c0_g1_i1.p1  ORF type:complete len:391 (-),score=52.00 TRINITY_DN2626_c0_g1_i1:49-1221(-)
MENLATEGRASILAVTSEVSDDKCQAQNVLVEDPHRLWLSAQPAPQAFTLELAQPHPLIRFAGWHCWHDFPTNPQCVEILSSESLAPDAVWHPCLLAEGLPGAGTQLYELQPPIPPSHRFLRVSVLRTFGGTLVYMNRLFLFEVCPVAHTASHNVSAIVDRSPQPLAAASSVPATPAAVAPTLTAAVRDSYTPGGTASRPTYSPTMLAAPRRDAVPCPPAISSPPAVPKYSDSALWHMVGAVEARLGHCERQLAELREDRRKGVAPLSFLCDETLAGIVPPPAHPLPRPSTTSSSYLSSPQEEVDVHLQEAVDKAVRASLRKLGPRLEKRVVEAINEKLDDRFGTIQRSVDAKVELYLRHMRDQIDAQMRTTLSARHSGFTDPQPPPVSW